jgi:hypothetical protein
MSGRAPRAAEGRADLLQKLREHGEPRSIIGRLPADLQIERLFFSVHQRERGRLLGQPNERAFLAEIPWDRIGRRGNAVLAGRQAARDVASRGVRPQTDDPARSRASLASSRPRHRQHARGAG